MRKVQVFYVQTSNGKRKKQKKNDSVFACSECCLFHLTDARMLNCKNGNFFIQFPDCFPRLHTQSLSQFHWSIVRLTIRILQTTREKKKNGEFEGGKKTLSRRQSSIELLMTKNHDRIFIFPRVTQFYT